MCNLEKYKSQLLVDIGIKRYKHSLRVAQTAVHLAEIYNFDKQKAYIAGLLHDCAKNKEEYYIKKFNFNIGDFPVDSINDPTLHSFLGAEVAKKVYNIYDKDLLNAIRYHTTGRENMSTLEKIIFIADAIEPNRDFAGIDKIRDESENDLDNCLLKLLDSNIKFLISKGLIINPLSFKSRNYLIKERNEKNRYNS